MYINVYWWKIIQEQKLNLIFGSSFTKGVGKMLSPSSQLPPCEMYKDGAGPDVPDSGHLLFNHPARMQLCNVLTAENIKNQQKKDKQV